MTPRRLRAAALILVVAVCVGRSGGRSPLQIAAAAGGTPGDVYLALGDSVAAGIGASRPAERGYAALVWTDLQRLVGRRVAMQDLAVPGETTSSMINGGQ